MKCQSMLQSSSKSFCRLGCSVLYACSSFSEEHALDFIRVFYFLQIMANLQKCRVGCSML